MTTPLLYIHGFASSGHSAKARILQNHFPRVYAPSLSHIPQLAVETLEAFIDALAEPPVLVGSSMGGFYALYLAQRFALPAVLVNPLIDLDLPPERIVGLRNSYFDASQFEFTMDHARSLRDYWVANPDTGRLMLMVQRGDELFDHDHSCRRLAGAQLVVEDGGDHSFSGFERHMDTIAEFAGRVAGA